MKALFICSLLLITVPVFSADHDVSVSNFQFTPSDLTIAVGDTVTWTNAGGFHNVEADDGSFRCAIGCDDTGGNGAASSAAWSFSRTFNSVEEIAYFCVVHGSAGGSGMAGILRVVDMDTIFANGFEQIARLFLNS